MRKLKLQVQLSLDGFMAGPAGEMDWMTWNWDSALKAYVDEITAPADLILLGRKTAEGFIQHWAGVAANPDDPEHPAGRKFTDTPKLVFSRTRQHMDGTAVRAEPDLSKAVIDGLKSQPGGDIIAYGGASFVSSLIAQRLVDEYHLLINPAALGRGLPIFQGLEARLDLKLLRSQAFSCGIVALTYAPA